MKYIIDIDKEDKQRLINITAALIIHGKIGKKEVTSCIGKQCATKIVNSCFSYLEAFTLGEGER